MLWSFSCLNQQESWLSRWRIYLRIFGAWCSFGETGLWGIIVKLSGAHCVSETCSAPDCRTPEESRRAAQLPPCGTRILALSPLWDLSCCCLRGKLVPLFMSAPNSPFSLVITSGLKSCTSALYCGLCCEFEVDFGRLHLEGKFWVWDGSAEPWRQAVLNRTLTLSFLLLM